MKIIGLTGGIGTGKSTVSNFLLHRKHVVIDADKIARDVVMPGQPGLVQIAQIFGDDILLPDGNLNRAKLGEIVFNDGTKRDTLNKIIHPHIREVINARIEQARIAGKEIVFLDIPLLYEGGFETICHAVWVLYVPEQVRVSRIMERDNLTREAVMKRISSQLDEMEKRQRADIIIDNSGDKKALFAQLEDLLKES